MITRGQVDPYPPLEPAPWWSVLQPYSPVEVLVLVVLAVLVLAYLSGMVITLHRTMGTVRDWFTQRRLSRRHRPGAPAQILPPSWVTLALAIPYGLLLAVVWPGPRLAYWALGDRE